MLVVETRLLLFRELVRVSIVEQLLPHSKDGPVANRKKQTDC